MPDVEMSQDWEDITRKFRAKRTYRGVPPDIAEAIVADGAGSIVDPAPEAPTVKPAEKAVRNKPQKRVAGGNANKDDGADGGAGKPS